MAFEMKIEGLAELNKRLDELKTTQGKRILVRGLQAAAAVFKEEEEQRAPERPVLPSGTALPPGALKRDVTVAKLRGKNIVVIGPGKYTQQAAHLVENGHLLVRGGKRRKMKYGLIKGNGKVVGHVPPHPYIRPAFEAGQGTALDAMVESIKADIARLDSKGSRKAGK